MLVLAMEFSRGARSRRRYCRRPDEGRERSTTKKAVDFAEAATNVAPSKRNSEVRRSRRPGYGAGLAAPSRGTGGTDCRREFASAE